MPNGAREPGLDVFRGLIVAGMFAVHSARLQRPGTPNGGAERFAQAALNGLTWLEPYLCAAFLFVSGVSAVLAHRRDHAGLRRTLTRAAALLALSIALFVAHYGLVVPDALVSSGTLGVIALGSVVVTLSLRSRRPEWWLCALLGCCALASAALERCGWSVVGANAGEGALLPEIGFAFAGALLAVALSRRHLHVLAAVLLCSAVTVALGLSGAQAWTSTQTRLYPLFPSETALGSLLAGAPPISRQLAPISFWNHTTVGFLASVLPLFANAMLLVIWARRVPCAGWVRAWSVLGRHALFAYLCHLALLSLLSAFALEPSTALWTWGCVALLIAASTIPRTSRLALRALSSRRRASP